MCNQVNLCTEMPLPPELLQKAASDAIRENPENIPGLMPQSMVGTHINRGFLALITGKKWARGRKLTVSFLGGNKDVIAKVKKYAKKWEAHAEIELDFVAKNGIIRISFDENTGSWSYIGTDALQIDSSSATMNYGWLFENTPDEEYERVVVHEFGHALGCIHEHQNPKASIPWDKQKVYKYYSDRLGWSKDQVDRNIFQKYGEDTTNFSSYDKLSIMHYAVPNELTVGDFEVPWNTTLSSTDKSFIAHIY